MARPAWAGLEAKAKESPNWSRIGFYRWEALE